MTTATVTVAIPVLDEEHHLGACLDAVAAQTHPIAEVLVVDGGSVDATRALAARRPDVTVVDNPGRIQAAGLNVALARAKGEVFVRVDGHTIVAPDYVERCVEALDRTGAAMVGGGMTPLATTTGMQRAIATSMRSSFGVGPARFHREGWSGWVDTVYLGAYRTGLVRWVGGYAEDVGVNEDAELAIRMAAHGGIWLDGTIRSVYVPRRTLPGVARQFFRYGLSRAATLRRHPSTLRVRQAAGPLLIVGLLSPFRRRAAAAYATFVAVASFVRAHDARLLLVLPVMHVSWGTGLLVGLGTGHRPRRRRLQAT